MNNFTGNVSKFTDYILKIDRCYGSFLGLAIGDAMGASLEFSQPGTFQPITYYQSGGPFNLPSGYWTDDTSMAICIAESLAHHKSLNLEDQMQRFVNWYRYGYASSTGTCFDIGNGSLMRIAPIPIAYVNKSVDEVKEACKNNSLLTHNEYTSNITAKFGGLLHAALNGACKSDLQLSYHEFMDYKPKIWNSGYAPESLAAALYHFHSTNSFEDAILQAVNCGDDSDTIGAITGQIAGAYYRSVNIPPKWIEGLFDNKRIIVLADSIFSIIK